ncbi:MAG: TetR/AcrR family transcriptional regulator [Nocardioidaceae bacterium]
MSSLRNTPLRGGPDHTGGASGPVEDDALLDAARASIVAVGWKRSTLTDVARRAGVSRMTIYRRWPDMQTLVADLMTREWSGLADAPSAGNTLERLAQGVASTVSALRANELFHKIVHVDPELLLPYLLERRGRTQDGLLALLEAGITEGQRDGSVRDGDPTLLARSVLLTAHGFVLSAATMTDRRHPLAAFDDQLQDLVEEYLRP